MFRFKNEWERTASLILNNRRFTIIKQERRG
jgi:hypothetical protein